MGHEAGSFHSSDFTVLLPSQRRIRGETEFLGCSDSGLIWMMIVNNMNGHKDS
jgi:hypothetical protein